jgi:NitT/TauT family transport system ATP-binding protein
MRIIILGMANSLSDYQIEIKDVNKQFNNRKESIHGLDHISFGVKLGKLSLLGKVLNG